MLTVSLSQCFGDHTRWKAFWTGRLAIDSTSGTPRWAVSSGGEWYGPMTIESKVDPDPTMEFLKPDSIDTSKY